MKAAEVVKYAALAAASKTLYVKDCCGWWSTDRNKEWAIRSYLYNRLRADKIRAAEDTWFFDCVNLVKAILWGWVADPNAKTSQGERFGGAEPRSNGVGDWTVDEMLEHCSDVSDDMTTVRPGEMLWMKGHVGIYVGSGQAVECTGSAGKVVKRSVSAQSWKKHGKLPSVDYKDETTVYRVQIGAYVIKANAEKKLEEAKKAGFSDAYITEGTVRV